MRDVFDESKRYVRFGDEDEAALRELGALLSPTFASIVDEFYSRLAEHPGAMAVLTGGEPQLQRLKASLIEWLQVFFRGPWDDAYFDQRARIGRRHVEVGLSQHYMLTAMALIRRHLCDEVLALAGPPERLRTRLVAVNKLCDLELAVMLHTYREDSRKRLQTAERLATFGEITSAICHELRNPLGVVESSNFILRRRVTDERALEHINRIQRQVRRAMGIISSMLDIVRDGPVNLRTCAVDGLCGRAAQHLHEERGVDVELIVPDPAPRVMVDQDQALQVLGNLLSNAADAAGPDGFIRLRVCEVVRDGRSMVRFVVSDSGPGIDARVAGRIFEPLVTTKAMGIGLGLALSRKLAEQQEGHLGVVAGELAGAGFAFDVPRSEAASSQPPAAGAPP